MLLVLVLASLYVDAGAALSMSCFTRNFICSSNRRSSNTSFFSLFSSSLSLVLPFDITSTHIFLSSNHLSSPFFSESLFSSSTSHDITADALCSNLARFACDNIDIEKQLELAQRLLEALIGNSIKKHPRQITGKSGQCVCSGWWEVLTCCV